jgi:DNA-directed RNA polymerase specialized sigma24 family protein
MGKEVITRRMKSFYWRLRSYQPILCRRMNDQEMAEDVLQDTLLSIHRAAHLFPVVPVGRGYSSDLRSSNNRFLRWHRRVEKVEIALTDDIEPQSEENKRGRSVLEALAACRKNSSRSSSFSKSRVSVKEVSAATGMSESSVKVTAFRGYESIRQTFWSL